VTTAVFHDSHDTVVHKTISGTQIVKCLTIKPADTAATGATGLTGTDPEITGTVSSYSVDLIVWETVGLGIVGQTVAIVAAQACNCGHPDVATPILVHCPHRRSEAVRAVVDMPHTLTYAGTGDYRAAARRLCMGRLESGESQ
jgi:hypothetical protein